MMSGSIRFIPTSYDNPRGLCSTHNSDTTRLGVRSLGTRGTLFEFSSVPIRGREVRLAVSSTFALPFTHRNGLGATKVKSPELAVQQLSSPKPELDIHKGPRPAKKANDRTRCIHHASENQVGIEINLVLAPPTPLPAFRRIDETACGKMKVRGRYWEEGDRYEHDDINSCQTLNEICARCRYTYMRGGYARHT